MKNDGEFKILILAEVHIEGVMTEFFKLCDRKLTTEKDTQIKAEVGDLLGKLYWWLIKQSNKYGEYHRVFEISKKDRIKYISFLEKIGKDHPLYPVLKWRAEAEPFEWDVPRKLSAKLIGHDLFGMPLRLREFFSSISILRIIKRLKKQNKNKLLIITGSEHAEIYKKILLIFGYNATIIEIPDNIKKESDRLDKILKS